MFHTRRDLEEEVEAERDKIRYSLFMQMMIQADAKAAYRQLKKEIDQEADQTVQREEALQQFALGDPFFHTVLPEVPDEILEEMMKDQGKFGKSWE